MKYRRKCSTVFISAVVLIVLLAISIFLFPRFSPVDKLTKTILEELSESQSVIDISVGSFDSGMLNSIILRDVRISGSFFSAEIAEIESKMGIFKLTEYLLFKRGAPTFLINEAKVKIDPERIDRKESSSFDLDIPFEVIADGIDIEIIGYCDIEGVSFVLSAGKDIILKGSADTLHGGINSYDFLFGKIRFEYSGTAVLTSESCLVSGEKLSAFFEYPSLEYHGDGQLSVKADSVAMEYGGIELLVSKPCLEIDGGLSGKTESIDLRFGIYSSDIDECEFSVRTDSLSILLNRVRVSEENKEIIDADSLSAESNDYRIFTLNIPFLRISELFEETELISALYIDSMNASFSSDDKSFSLELNLIPDSPYRSIYGSEFHIISSLIPHERELYVDIVSDIFGVDSPTEIEFRYGRDGVELVLNAGSSLYLNAMYKDKIFIYSSLTEFHPYSMINIISDFFPIALQWVGEGTELSGYILVDFENSGEFPVGPASFALAASDLKFNLFDFSLSASLSSYLTGNSLDISNFSVTTDQLRASWVGSYYTDRNLVDGSFTIASTNTGSEIFTANLNLADTNEYTFEARLPKFKSGYLTGLVDFTKDNLILSDSILFLRDRIYPLNLIIDLLDKSIQLENENLSMNLSYGEGIIDLNASIDDFPLFSDESFVNGILNAYINLTTQKFSGHIDNFSIGTSAGSSMGPRLIFSVDIDNTGLIAHDILIEHPDMDSLSGTLIFDSSDRSLASRLSSGNEDIEFSVHAEKNEYYGILRSDNFDMSRVGLKGYTGSANFTVYGKSLFSLSFTGDINAKNSNGGIISTHLSLDTESLRVIDFALKKGNASIEIPSLVLDFNTGGIAVESDFVYMLRHADGDYPISFSAEINGNTGIVKPITASILNYLRNGLSFLTVEGRIIDFNFMNQFLTPERNFKMEFSDGIMRFSGTLISGYRDTGTGSTDVSIDLGNPVKLDIKTSESGIEVDIAALDAALSNFYYTSPVVHFYPGSVVKGELYFVKDGPDWNMFGSLNAEYGEFDVFWLPDQRIYLHNAEFVVWDNVISSLITDATVLDLRNYERKHARVDVSFTLSPSLSFSGWDLNVYTDSDAPLRIRLPMTNSNMDLHGDVKGHLGLDVSGSDYFMYGDLESENMRLSVGMEELPSWWSSSDTVLSMDLNILLAENTTFVFPLTNKPILTAYASDNQSIRVVLGDGGLRILGNIDLKSGEAFYFTKTFYITEGTISFPNFLSDISFSPVINLRARLRDFDEDGNSVDIYLVLKDATLDNLSPVFESSPSKSINEIMSLLSGAILPDEIYGNLSFSSISSLLYSSFDVLNRVGVFNFGSSSPGFSETAKDALGLSTFSIHTLILSNIFADTLAIFLDSSRGSLSPAARYLDGTSVYMGKYINKDMYLEGIIRLSSTDSNKERSKYTFLSDDLKIDMEFAFEWSNPLATFRVFTKPEILTPFSVMDGLGFSVTKRFTWL